MSSAFEIIHHRVGAGGHRHGPDVVRLQQLLRLNGYDGIDKRPRVNPHLDWDKATEDALADFRERQALANPTMLYYDDTIQSDRPYVVPNDRILFDLAYGAGVLIRLTPGGKINRGAIAFEDVHNWCEENLDGFAWRHAVWSLNGYPMWAIVTNERKDGTYYFDWQAPQDKYVRTPRALNCTLYVNLMMSVWLQGNIHSAPYSADVSKSGDAHHLAHERYKYPLLGLKDKFEEVEAEVQKHPHRLYCLEAGENIWHMALLFKGRVFEYNVGKNNCHSLSLKHWMESEEKAWLSGPSPG